MTVAIRRPGRAPEHRSAKSCLALSVATAWFLAVPGSAQAAGPDLTGYKLLLDDEFNGDKLDLKKWQVGTQPNGGQWGSDSYFATATPADAAMFSNAYTVKDGMLTLRATYKPDMVDPNGWNRKWYSGMIATAFSDGRPPSAVFRRGYVEIRQKFPAGLGVWPANWALNLQSQAGGPSVEIDGLEAYGVDMSMFHTTVHKWSDKTYSAATAKNLPDLTSEFHTYGYLVDDDSVYTYLDGAFLHKIALVGGTKEDKYFWMFNLAMGGGWPVKVPESGHYDMQIDYIRIYSNDPDATVAKP